MEERGADSIKDSLKGTFSSFGENVDVCADWLTSQITNYYTDGDANSFGGLREWEGPCFQILSDIYQLVPASSKGVFLQAIRKSLLSAQENSVPLNGIEDLISTAYFTKDSDMLDVLPTIINSFEEGGAKARVIGLAISVLYNLSPSEETYNITKQIVDDPAIIDDAWLFEALDTLVKYKPEETLATVNNCLPRLEKAIALCDNIPDNKWKSDTYKFINECIFEAIKSSPSRQKGEVSKILSKLVHKIDGKNSFRF